MEHTLIMIKHDGVQRGLLGKSCLDRRKILMGATDPRTVRGDFIIDIPRNVIHGSDAVESATKEIACWFPECLANSQGSLHPWIYE